MNYRAFTLACGIIILARVSFQAHTQPVYTPYSFTTLAGSSDYGSTDGLGNAAQFNRPRGIALDLGGNIYVADSGNSVVRKVSPAGIVTTLAGIAGQQGSADGASREARFYFPYGVAVDRAGDVYVADTGNDTIRKVTPAGLVTTIAGRVGVPGSDDGLTSNARFYGPSGVAVDSSGNLYVADYGNSTIRKITPAGMVTTLAGLAGMWGAADGVGSAAQFFSETGLAVDATGNLYVADTYNYTIRKVSPSGIVTTVAGLAGLIGNADGPGNIARFYDPLGVALDGSGNVFVAEEGDNTIRQLAPSGTNWVVSTLAGLAGDHRGYVNGTGAAARFFAPGGIAVDGVGNVYVADTGNNVIRKGSPMPDASYTGQTYIINPPLNSTVAAGADASFVVVAFGRPPFTYRWQFNGYDLSGATNSALTLPHVRSANAGLYQVIVTDGLGQSFTPYAFLTVISSILIAAQPTNTTVTVGSDVTFNVTATSALPMLYQWRLFGFDLEGATNSSLNLQNAQVTDSGFYSVSVSNADDSISSQDASLNVVGPVVFGSYPQSQTVLEGESVAFSVSLNSGVRVPVTYQWRFNGSDLAGATNASLSLPNVQLSNSGEYQVIVSNVFGGVTSWPATLAVQRYLTPYTFTTLAGGAAHGSTDGPGGAARFYAPGGLTVDDAGNTYVADTTNNTIRKVTASGIVSTIAGTTNSPFFASADGPGDAAMFFWPSGVAVDAAGSLYVADTYNHTIRKVTPHGTNWVVTTLAGAAGSRGNADGVGNVARFNTPFGVAADRAGNLFVADSQNNTIRKVTPEGAVTTIAGLAGAVGGADGNGSAASFRSPFGVAVDGSGAVFVADNNNHTIRKLTLMGTNWMVTTMAGKAGSWGAADGPGDSARFDHPRGVAVDLAGNVYVADTTNCSIRKITPEGMVTTLAGFGAGNADGVGRAVRFWEPQGVAVDRAGNVYVADAFNNSIRKGYPTTVLANPGTSASVGGREYSFSLSGPPGRFVVVESSTDLATWLPIWTNTFTTNLSFSDLLSDSFSRRFYRARLP